MPLHRGRDWRLTSGDCSDAAGKCTNLGDMSRPFLQQLGYESAHTWLDADFFWCKLLGNK